MCNGFRFILTAAVGLAACAVAARGADDPKPYKSYTFDTSDGVKLDGDFYSNAASPNKKEATVLLLHDFDAKAGGSRASPGWSALAERLQKEGYSVFAFDFRGFGNSTAVNEKFWDRAKNPHNMTVKGANKSPLPETIKHTDFQSDYYPNLVNDVAAAKTWLDKNGENTSSFFIIGAGEGAAIGSLWMASEWHRQKGDLGPLGQILFDPKTGKPMLEDAEGIDEAGAIWLSPSPTIAGRSHSESIRSWMGDAGGEHKVPIGIYYGADDTASEKFAANCLTSINSGYRRANPGASDAQIKERLEHTIKFPIKDTKLAGSKLLIDDLPTMNAIVNFLEPVMKTRRNIAARTHDSEKSAIFWTFPGAIPIQAKQPTDPSLPLVPINKFIKGGG